MLKIRFTNKFKKDLKRVKKRGSSGFDEEEFKMIISKLANNEPLDEKYNDHPLQGKFKGTREFHLAFDLVVIYEIHDDILELHLIRMGTHEEVF